jgi:serine/threonine protein kinase
MQFCGGETLFEYLETERDELEELDSEDEMRDYVKMSRLRAFEIFDQILKAVISLHEHKIVHRDLKPMNVFLDSQN